MLPHPALSAPPRVAPRYARSYRASSTHHRTSTPSVRAYSASYAYGVPAPPQLMYSPLPQASRHSYASFPHATPRPPHYAAAVQQCTQAARSERVKLYAFLAVFLIWVTAWGVLAYFYVQGGL